VGTQFNATRDPRADELLREALERLADEAGDPDYDGPSAWWDRWQSRIRALLDEPQDGPDGEKIPCPTCHGDARVPLTTDELWAALAEVTNDDMDVCLGPSGIAISLNGSDFSEWLPTLADALRAALSRFRLDGDAHAVE
jgi:plasmid stabilization system protein ParE